jgi:hypothetical protein
MPFHFHAYPLQHAHCDGLEQHTAGSAASAIRDTKMMHATRLCPICIPLRRMTRSYK